MRMLPACSHHCHCECHKPAELADDRSRDVDLLNAVDAFKEMGAREERRRAAGIMRALLAAMDDGDMDDAEAAMRAYVAEAEEAGE